MWGEHVQNQLSGEVEYTQRYWFVRAHAWALSSKYGVSSLYSFPTTLRGIPKEAEEELELWMVILRRAHDRLLMRGGSLTDDPPKGSELDCLYARINESRIALNHPLEFAKRVERYIKRAESRTSLAPTLSAREGCLVGSNATMRLILNQVYKRERVKQDEAK